MIEPIDNPRYRFIINYLYEFNTVKREGINLEGFIYNVKEVSIKQGIASYATIKKDIIYNSSRA